MPPASVFLTAVADNATSKGKVFCGQKKIYAVVSIHEQKTK